MEVLEQPGSEIPVLNFVKIHDRRHPQSPALMRLDLAALRRGFVGDVGHESSMYGSFTMANSNSFLSSYETLSIAQENKYLR